MNCAQCKELLVAYIEGLVQGPQAQLIREHLEKCDSCRSEARDIARLHDRLAGNGKAIGPSNFEDEVMKPAGICASNIHTGPSADCL